MSSPPARTLVVDDNRDLAENVAELFQDAGFDACVAPTGKIACKLGAEYPFHLAVVDLRLPDMTGLEIVTALKQLRPQAEIILMTANATLQSAIAAVNEGAYAYVQKPFDPSELLRLGQHALQQVYLREERARLQNELAQSEALHRGVVDNVSSLIVGLDDRGVVHMWNRCAAQTTGYSAEQVLGHPLGDVLESSGAKERLAEALRTAAAGGPVSELDLPLRTQTGQSRWVRWSISTFSSPLDAPFGILAMGLDRTERVELERAATEAEAMAAVGTLTTGLAHEIRNPLNAAGLQLELLGRAAGKAPPELRGTIEKRVRIVREELSRLTELLGDFLQLSRPQRLVMGAVDIEELVGEVVQLQEPVAQRSGIRIGCQFEGGLPPIQGDRTLLRQILMNLITNSLEAVVEQGQGQVDISGARAGACMVEVRIHDSGPGIADEVAPNLFTPFVTSKAAGTGLGLTIVKRIVDRHGGTITLTSPPEGGTVARLLMPCAE